MPNKNFTHISYVTDVPYFVILFFIFIILFFPTFGIVLPNLIDITFPKVWIFILITLDIYLLIKTYIYEKRNEKEYPLKYWAIEYTDHNTSISYEPGKPGEGISTISTTTTTYDLNSARSNSIEKPDSRYVIMHRFRVILLSTISIVINGALGIWIQTFDFEVNLFLIVLPLGILIHIFLFHEYFYIMHTAKLHERIKTEKETGEKTLVYVEFENWVHLINRAAVSEGTEMETKIMREKLCNL